MEVLLQNQQGTVIRVLSPAGWRQHAHEILTGSIGASWQCLLYWTKQTPEQTVFHLVARSISGQPLWTVRLGVSPQAEGKSLKHSCNDQNTAQILGGSIFHEPSSTSLDLFRATLKGLNVHGKVSGISLDEKKPSSIEDDKSNTVNENSRLLTLVATQEFLWQFMPSEKPSNLGPAIRPPSGASFINPIIRMASKTELANGLLEQLCLLTQSHRIRRGLPAINDFILRGTLTEIICHPEASTYLAEYNNKLRGYILVFRRKIIMGGVYSPRRDQGVMEALIQNAGHPEFESQENQIFVPQTTVRPDSIFKRLMPVRNVQLLLMSTQGPELSFQSQMSLIDNDTMLICQSWDLTGTLTGYTIVDKKNLPIENWRLDWKLPAQTAALVSDCSINEKDLSYERVHYLRRQLLCRGYLGIIAAAPTTPEAEELQKLGFIKMNSLYGWRKQARKELDLD